MQANLSFNISGRCWRKRSTFAERCPCQTDCLHCPLSPSSCAVVDLASDELVLTGLTRITRFTKATRVTRITGACEVRPVMQQRRLVNDAVAHWRVDSPMASLRLSMQCDVCVCVGQVHYQASGQRHYYFMNVGNGEVIDACRKVSCLHI
jgi:hypothetical protein